MSDRHRFAAPLLVMLMCLSCRMTTSQESRPWHVLFGPVVASELIVGRVLTNSTVWIMTGSDELVTVDLDRGRSVRHPLHPLRAGEHVWGLAMGRGELWTLIGRTVLGQIGRDGQVTKRIDLMDPHVGLFGGGDALLYQVMNFQPPADALMAGPPGEHERRIWGRLRTRALPLARPAVAALNLVSCGSSATGILPCWFPDQAVITLTSPAGESRELALDSLPTVAPEVLLAAEHPPRPIRDAFVSSGSQIWVLGSGRPPTGDQGDRIGGWLLVLYDDGGRVKKRMSLPEPARLVLSADANRCLLLAWDGRVVEVRL